MVLCGLSFIAAFPAKYPTDDRHIDKFVRETAQKWRNKYGEEPNLQAALWGRVKVYPHTKTGCMSYAGGHEANPHVAFIGHSLLVAGYSIFFDRH